MNIYTVKVRQIYRILGLSTPDESAVHEAAFRRLSSAADATPDAIVFAQDAATLQEAIDSQAGLILAPLDLEAAPDPRLLRVRDPKHAFAMCGRWFDSLRPSGIHPQVLIDPEAVIGPEATIAAGCVVHAGAKIGSHCQLDANVTVYGCVTLGDNVLVQAGTVLGAMGFGYVRDENGSYIRFPQQGSLVIEDDVEIGSNSTIDRGALGETRIGAGTKIDNLVHIGHNCRIGRNVVIAAQVGISGSCVVEDGAVLAGQVGISDHCHIGPGVILGGQAGVFRGASVEGRGELFAGTPAEPIKNFLKSLARLRRLK